NVEQLLPELVNYKLTLLVIFILTILILSGIAIGIAANYLLRHVQTLQRFQKDYEQGTKQKWSPMFTKK
ncbi:heptaprenyl diphosphate synthase, partial [Enterococcus faecium]|nr:heptaprenyl diphosphate synthase [Enterococcus faecium]MCZ1881831.1 heptaprenyl diphosphate synthase [Enterococcus faecium]